VALRQEEFTSLTDDVDLDRDRTLVERCQAGDSAAFGNLYARYYERLLRFCLRRLNDRHEAEDAAQEAFARAWKALPKFAGERRFYPWLTVIAGNICTDVLRRRSRSTPTDDLELGAYQPVGGIGAETSEELILAAVDGQLVNRALDRLSTRHRHVLAMREGEGWSYQQMAEHEGVEIGTIETLLWRARQALKREFNVLSESKAALAGFLVGAGALVRRGVLRVAGKAALVPPGGGSGGLRNALAGAAVTSAAVAAALITPHALATSHPNAQVSPADRTASALANPALPITLALVHTTAPATSGAPANLGTASTGPGPVTGGGSPAVNPTSATSLTPSGQLPTGSLVPPGSLLPSGTGVSGLPPLPPVLNPLGTTLGQATSGVTNTVSGLANTLGLSTVLSQIGLVPAAGATTPSNAPTSPSSVKSTITSGVTKVVNGATSTLKGLLGQK
jgi:RNA polymerase sigma-70 factor (ECF subfamily)